MRVAMWCGVLLCGLLIVLAVLYALTLREPEWYQALERTPGDIRATQLAAIRVEDALVNVRNWASDNIAAERRRVRDGSQEAAGAGSTVVLEFSDADLNASIEKWAQTQGWEDLYGSYISRPRVAFRKDGVLLAAKVRGFGSVVNTRIAVAAPAEGRFGPQLGGIYAGSVPIPRTLFDGQFADASAIIKDELITLAAAARTGSASNPTCNHSAAMTQLAMMVLWGLGDGTAGKPPTVVVLPMDDDRYYPAYLADVRVSDGAVRLVLATMTQVERNEWIAQLRAAGKLVESAAAPAKSAPPNSAKR